MTKQSEVDEQSDAFFLGLDSRKSITPSERVSGFDRLAPHAMSPIPGERSRIPTRQKFMIPVGLSAVCLVTAALVFARFQTASTAAAPHFLSPAILPTSIISAPPEPKKFENVQDTQSPSVPGKLTATNASDTTVSLAWEASSDNTGVVGYTIYRNGVSVATISSADLTFRDIAVMPDTTYSYALDAYDQAGNHSAVSAPLQVNTPAQPGNQIFFRPEEDTYVNAANPTTVYGTAVSLRMDSSPDIHAYLRFIVSGLNGKKITQARLMLYTKSGTARGIQVRAVTGNSWSELGSDYNNAPAIGDLLASSTPTDNAAWIALDLTPYVTGEGRFNFALVTNSSTAVSLASREAGAEAPQLIIDLH
jgi:chitodextrinase